MFSSLHYYLSPLKLDRIQGKINQRREDVEDPKKKSVSLGGTQRHLIKYEPESYKGENKMFTLLLTNKSEYSIEAEVVVREDSGLRSVALHSDEHASPSGLHTFFEDTRVVSRQSPGVRELKLNVLQFDVVHAVGGHRAARKKNSAVALRKNHKERLASESRTTTSAKKSPERKCHHKDKFHSFTFVNRNMLQTAKNYMINHIVFTQNDPLIIFLEQLRRKFGFPIAPTISKIECSNPGLAFTKAVTGNKTNCAWACTKDMQASRDKEKEECASNGGNMWVAGFNEAQLTRYVYPQLTDGEADCEIHHGPLGKRLRAVVFSDHDTQILTDDPAGWLTKRQEGFAPRLIFPYLTSKITTTHAILERNSGYDNLYTISQIPSKEIRDTPKDIAQNHIHLLKYAPVTSCEAERSFSLYKNILYRTL
ncbi:hypothetical protein C0J52_21015 [Blattella germanica]|nr:hypothetical protein C0J52_21015 [Blattella germanica]